MRRILRYTLTERLVHWAAGLSYVYLLLTGLAFWSPTLFWLTVFTGGGAAARAWHPWAGLLFAAAVARMYELWRRDMRATEYDRAWNRAMGAYVRNEDENLPPAGRFNPGQKMLFWVMFWGGAVLLVSGIVLWFPEYVPWNWRAVRAAAVLVHAGAALVTIGAFIVHVYMGAAVVRGGFTSIIRGEVTEDWARAHHPLWLAEVSREPGRKQ